MTKIAAIVLLLLLDPWVLNAGIVTDIVVPTRQQIAANEIPIFCYVIRQHDGGVIVRVALKPFAPVGSFNHYSLYVWKEQASGPSIKKDFSKRDLVVRKEFHVEKTAKFELRKDEILNSFIVVGFSTDKVQSGMAVFEDICIPVSALLSQGTMGP